jgi:predicted patatin/cPLA2 family phospholipase
MVTNRGVVTDVSQTVPISRLIKFISGKNALVAQGGGQRGIFTAGVLDAFLLSNFDPYHEYYGTSAGALNLCAFLCRQPGLSQSFIVDLTTRREFFSLFGYIRRKQLLGLDWALEQTQRYPYRLDVDLGRHVMKNKRAFAAVTDVQSLTDRYLPMLQTEWYQPLLASCAIPTLYPNPVIIDGHQFVDGGVSASIPVQEAWRQGARMITIIRTEQASELNSSICHRGESGLAKEPLVSLVGNVVGQYHSQWQQALLNWKQEWQSFLRTKGYANDRVKAQILNGGRWLFGADDIYRLAYLIGDKYSPQTLDMLMVHYQTYGLTLDFIQQPPDDAFIIEIAPEQPLKSGPLLSRPSDLMHDYDIGLKAGYRFIKLLNDAVKSNKPCDESPH